MEYHQTKDLFKDPEKYNNYPVYPTTAFYPGGLAVIMGPTFGQWEQLKSVGNKNNAKITIKQKSMATRNNGSYTVCIMNGM